VPELKESPRPSCAVSRKIVTLTYDVRAPEEAGITAKLEHRGTLLFMSPENTEAAHIEVYYAEDFDGKITESEEMRPEWFAIPDPDARHDDII